jgi:hypothetical protein
MRTENFTFSCRDEEVVGQVIYMHQCCLVWLGRGGATPQLGDLSVSMMTPHSTYPLSSSLIEPSEGGDAGAAGQSVSRGVAKKYGLQCFVSYNLPGQFEENLVEIMGPVFAAIEKSKADYSVTATTTTTTTTGSPSSSTACSA